MLRVHLGSCRVYLRGWTNVELPAPNVFRATDRPDLVERWGVDDDGPGYYAKQAVPVERLAQGPLPPTDIVCDMREDWLNRPCFAHGSVHEVLARQVFEHLSRIEAERALEQIDYMLAPGGVLRLDVPDHEATVAELVTCEDATRRRFLVRHLLGHRASPYGYHLQGYSRAGLRTLVERFGFVAAGEEPPLPGRLYPAFTLRFQKPTVEAYDPIPWQRLIPADGIPADWRCLEIGPGTRRAWPRANAVIDVIDRGAPDDRPAGSVFHLGDICARTPFADHEFDLVFASHVLEHVEDPVAAAAEISRIAKRGVLECPHPFKEFLLGFEETDHRWWVWPAAADGTLVFQAPDRRIVDGWRDTDYSGAMQRLLRLGPIMGGHDGRLVRAHYVRGQRFEILNTVHRWEGPLRVAVRA